jgi:ribosome-binding protein aMBF1 (putative translation factor)
LGLSRFRFDNDGFARGAKRPDVTKSVFTTRYDYFRQLLLQARKDAPLSQAALAKRLSRPQSFVSKFERGERRLDVVEFLDVAEAIGINPYRFLAKVARHPQQRRKR